MTTKHSPLPWKRSGHQIIDANGNLVVDFALGIGWIADADDVIRAVNSHADLLAACKAAMQTFSAKCEGQHSWPKEQLRTAIERAEGKQ